MMEGNLGQRSLKVIQTGKTGTIRKLGCGFRVAFQGSILYHIRDKATHWPKIDFFILWKNFSSVFDKRHDVHDSRDVL